MTEMIQAKRIAGFRGRGYDDEDVVRTSVIGRRIEVYFDRPIESPEEHRDEIHAIRSAGPDDTVILYINTPGGWITTTQAIINAMAVTPAEIIAVLEGQIASAGTMIACAAPNIQVMPHTQFMIHSASEGVGGILRNNAAYAAFSARETERLMRDIYRDFLTDDELKQVFDGREIWMNDDELLQRFKQRADKRNAEVTTDEEAE